MNDLNVSPIEQCAFADVRWQDSFASASIS